MKVGDLVRVMEDLAPLGGAEPWDNVGLLAGDLDDPIARVLLSIDCTRAVVDEAAGAGCQAIVAYHPAIFQAIKRVTRGGVAYELVRRGIALYSPHTALDAALGGTNDALADAVGMIDRAPVRPLAGADGGGRGMGRIGRIESVERAELVQRIKAKLGLSHVLVAGRRDGAVTRVAVCAGSPGDLLDEAIRQRAEIVVTGEVRHHDALRAAGAGVTLVCTLHSNSERLALVSLAERLRAALPGLQVQTSEADRDPYSIA